jgi:hypothetical protein
MGCTITKTYRVRDLAKLPLTPKWELHEETKPAPEPSGREGDPVLVH